MKKLLLFLLPLFILSSCKDDKEEPAPIIIPDGEISHTLQGKWINYEVKREYFSMNDTILYADSAEVLTTFEFKGNQMIINGSSSDSWTYDLPDKDNPNYITFTKGSQVTDYEVLSISDTAMVWLDEQPWAGYPIDVPDDQKKTSKVGKYTYMFTRQE